MRARTTRRKIPGVPRWVGHYCTHTTGWRAGPDGSTVRTVTAREHVGPVRLRIWRKWRDVVAALDRWADPHQLWTDPTSGLHEPDDDEEGGHRAVWLRR